MDGPKDYDINTKQNKTQMNLQKRDRITDIENISVVAKEGVGKGWIESLGLADANDYI